MPQAPPQTRAAAGRPVDPGGAMEWGAKGAAAAEGAAAAKGAAAAGASAGSLGKHGKEFSPSNDQTPHAQMDDTLASVKSEPKGSEGKPGAGADAGKKLARVTSGDARAKSGACDRVPQGKAESSKGPSAPGSRDSNGSKEGRRIKLTNGTEQIGERSLEAGEDNRGEAEGSNIKSTPPDGGPGSSELVEGEEAMERSRSAESATICRNGSIPSKGPEREKRATGREKNLAETRGRGVTSGAAQGSRSERMHDHRFRSGQNHKYHQREERIRDHTPQQRESLHGRYGARLAYSGAERFDGSRLSDERGGRDYCRYATGEPAGRYRLGNAEADDLPDVRVEDLRQRWPRLDASEPSLDLSQLTTPSALPPPPPLPPPPSSAGYSQGRGYSENAPFQRNVMNLSPGVDQGVTLVHQAGCVTAEPQRTDPQVRMQYDVRDVGHASVNFATAEGRSGYVPMEDVFRARPGEFIPVTAAADAIRDTQAWAGRFDYSQPPPGLNFLGNASSDGYARSGLSVDQSRSGQHGQAAQPQHLSGRDGEVYDAHSSLQAQVLAAPRGLPFLGANPHHVQFWHA